MADTGILVVAGTCWREYAGKPLKAEGNHSTHPALQDLQRRGWYASIFPLGVFKTTTRDENGYVIARSGDSISLSLFLMALWP